ncbi:MinD/ParA family ATP-binding protein [Streptomyces armeniacus]|uniref:MinD/ParA family ATP-binding protein n=1 Tax=Streptomyces armeniacus TaxID=83291 RepID=UPI001AD82316|nr:chromosome partitioning protein [Streptomyces armeniacus]
MCSVKGSPGVTTACVALAARWPDAEQPVVVETDPAGGDLLARWRLELSPGLVSLAAAARRTAEPGLVWQHTQRLPGGLPVVAGPAGARQAHGALHALTNAPLPVLRSAADRAGVVVIADCGQIGPDSAALPVLRSADVMLLLARARDDALAHVATRWEEATRWSHRSCFVLVGDGYPSAEISAELGIEVLGRIPEDAKGAGAWSGQPGSRTRPGRSAMGRVMAELAARVSTRSRAPSAGEHVPPTPSRRGDVHPVPGQIPSVSSPNGMPR